MKELPVEAGAFNRDEVYTLAGASLDYLSALANPEGHTANYPPTFQAVWKLLLTEEGRERAFPKIALGLPRGFGKTAVLKLFLLYCILYTDRRFIMIVASTSKMATNILADVCGFLDTPNIREVFGDWRIGLTEDTKESKKFGFLGRNIVMAAIGESGSLRGINIFNARPDVICFDDIQSREDAMSEVLSNAIYTKMLSTTMKTKDASGCMYLFLGNMYPTKNSILLKLKNNPSWTTFIVGGILADGTSLWEAVHPIKQLLEEYQNDKNAGHPELFMSEVLNDENASVNRAIDISLIPEPILSAEIPAGSFIMIDPSNDKANSDLVSIGYFEIFNGVPVLMDVIDDRLSPGDIVRQAIGLAVDRGCSLIVVEANAFQYSLLYWFNSIGEQLGITGITYMPIYSGKLSKNSRILTMFKQLTANPAEVMLSNNVRSLVISYINTFNPLKNNNVDNVLDLLTYAPRIVAEMGHLTVINQSVLREVKVSSPRRSILRAKF